MRKYIDTGKTKVVPIKKIEYYCDTCGKKLDRNNPKGLWHDNGIEKHGCKNNPKCYPFHKDVF